MFITNSWPVQDSEHRWSGSASITLRNFVARVCTHTKADHRRKSSRNLGDNLARRIEAKLDLPKSWFDVFHEKILEQLFANVATESDFQPTRLKQMLWEDTAQDKKEFVAIPLLDIDFSAGGGCYEIIDHGEFSLIFRRYYLHKIGVAANAAPIIHISDSSMEPRLQDGNVAGINTAARRENLGYPSR